MTLRSLTGHYDDEQDILAIYFDPGDIAHSVEHWWGLVDFGADGSVIGLEVWEASSRVPGLKPRA